MKKLSKIKLQNAVVLEEQEMKKIYGGSGSGSGRNYHWCVIHGESVGPFSSCTDAWCQSLYGQDAYCD